MVVKHKPKAVLHWHGWGNDIAFPYSFDWRAPMSNGDLGMYQEFSTEMAATNHYASGRAWESVGYTTNGEADDWGWGEARAVSMTIEVGSSKDGFWPPPSRVLEPRLELHPGSLHSAEKTAGKGAAEKGAAGGAAAANSRVSGGASPPVNASK